MTEKRSPDDENAQLSLLPTAPGPGVGARQPPPGLHPGGGGYQGVCMGSKFEKKIGEAEKNAAHDPRLDELRAMGLQRAWVAAAEAVGVDAVLAVWRILDADPSSSYDGTTLRVPLRAWRTYLRYQRNRYIDSLRDLGLRPHEIQRRLQQQLGERVSISHIKRLAARR